MSGKVTKAMQQYYRIKKEHEDAVVFFQLGDFYETFNEDAKIASKALDITLTSRGMGADGERTPLAGVPVKAIDSYLKKMIDQGYKVVIVDQLEDAKNVPSGKIVKRGVTRVVTPGTVFETSILDKNTNNFLLSIAVNEKRHIIGLSFIDISTSEFLVTEFHENVIDNFQDEFSRFNPREVIFPDLQTKGKLQASLEKIISTSQTVVYPVNETLFNFDTAQQTLLNHFEVSSLAGYGCDSMIEGIRAAGAIISYLKMLKKDYPSNISFLRTLDNRNHLILDSNTQRNLEIIGNAFDGKIEGSLLSIFTDISTSMGARLLRRWLLQPLRDINKINDRLNAVDEFTQDLATIEEINHLLSNVADFQRLVTKIKYRSVNARDLISLRNSLKFCLEILAFFKKRKFRSFICQKITNFEVLELSNVIDLIDDGIHETPAISVRDGDIIKPGYNDDLLQLHELQKNQDLILREIEQREQDRTSFNIKLGYNSIHGYYIEATKAQLRDAGEEAVPSDYVRRQTLVSAERFITPELKAIEEKILNADERIKELEYQLFCEIREEISKKVETIRQFAELIAELDVLVCFAFTAIKNDFCKPQFVNEPAINILDGRHPVVEQLQKETGFVPNSISLREGNLHIITGPNMSGKCVNPSTLIFTDKGILPIGFFKPNKIAKETFDNLEIEVVGINGRTKTSHFYYDGYQTTIRIKTRRGYTIEGTKNHPILIRTSEGREIWKKLSEIQKEDCLIINRKNDLWGTATRIEYTPPSYYRNVLTYPLPTELTEDLSYLLGILIGDGTLTYQKSFRFSTGDDFLASEFIRINQYLFNYQVTMKKDQKDFSVTSWYLRDFLKHLGLKYKKAHDKEIPECILKSPKSIIKAFFQGLFDTDGTAGNRYGNVTLSTTSSKLASQVHIILLNWNIVSSLKIKKTRKRPCYEIRITGVDAIKFHKEIGFRLARKRDRKHLGSSTRMTNIDSIPYLYDTLYKIKSNYLEKSSSIPKRDKFKYNKRISGIFDSYIPQNRNISYKKLKELIEYCNKYEIECKELEEIDEKHYFYDKIDNIETSESEVFDFTVPNGSSFVGNGIINHNSVFIRQVALIVLMAQTGSWVPAKECNLGIIDKIFTRVGAFDRLAFGQSTFMLEMLETAHILHNSTPDSLIILDEVGRGTSTFDGLSLAWAIAEYIARDKKSKTLFATHYHQLSELEKQYSIVKNYHQTAKVRNGKLVLLYKVREGSTDHSFGISVAKMAGIPNPVILEAQKKLLELESTSDTTTIPRSKEEVSRQPRQLSLAEALSKNVDQQQLENKLKSLKFELLAFLKNYTDIDVNYKTPIEAIQQLGHIVKDMQDLEKKLEEK
ncbi:MAG: DNA mismatch repair protein MutS [Candidatus Thorarchaeota archaeon]